MLDSLYTQLKMAIFAFSKDGRLIEPKLLKLPLYVLILIGITGAERVFELSAWFPYLLCFCGGVPMSLLIYYSIREKRIMAKRNYRKMKWVRPIAIGIYFSTYTLIVLGLTFLIFTIIGRKLG